MKMVWTVALLGVVLVCIPSPARGADDSSIDAILNAPDASTAAYAYAQATRLGGDTLAADKAYVSKMTDLGKPASAFEQAVEIVKQDPANGLAWAVQAYTFADRDEPVDAFTDLLLAVRYDQDNVFVTRTAGQLLAWYDSDMVDRDSLADSLRAEIGTVKIRYGDNPTFKVAYDEAARVYAGDITSNQPQQPPPADESYAPNPYPYPDQGGLDYAPPYPWDWYGYGQPWSLCNPFWDGCGGFAFSSGFRHHHDRDGDRGWNGSRFGARGARGSRGLTGPSGAIGGSGIAGLRSGRNLSTFSAAAAPPGVRSNGLGGFTRSVGTSPRFSVWHSNGMSGVYRSTGGGVNRFVGASGQTLHYGGAFRSSGGGFRSGGVGGRSGGGGGFRSSGGGGFRGGGGGFRGGGGGFHGGGGHGGGGHR